MSHEPIEDVVRALGYLTLGSRMKRIGERLQAQAQVMLEEADVSVSAAHFPVLAALERLGPLSVGELAQAVGVSQPGVTRMLDKLVAEGWVKSRQPAGDRRLRSVVLSRPGRQLVARAKRLLWPRIEAAVADACAGLTGPLLVQLTAVEVALAATPLHVRAARARARNRRHAAA
jgi:DNA-binding MarR family transcriptional regulator